MCFSLIRSKSQLTRFAPACLQQSLINVCSENADRLTEEMGERKKAHAAAAKEVKHATKQIEALESELEHLKSEHEVCGLNLYFYLWRVARRAPCHCPSTPRRSIFHFHHKSCCVEGFALLAALLIPG
jgi:FtsZ-binding cell division protein ZapB